MGNKLIEKQQKSEQKSLFQALKKVYSGVPISIRHVSISLFLFMLGWGLGADTYFSVYAKYIIGNTRGVGMIGTILAVSKMLLVIPIGNMNDHINKNYILLLGKILYVICGICYFFAGIMMSREILILACILNGFASATMFTTYRTYYGQKAKKTNQTKVFGLYFSSTNGAYVVGALISAFLVYFLELPYMYLFVIIFALISLLQDQKIQNAIRKSAASSRKKFHKNLKKSNYLIPEVPESDNSMQKFFGKNGFLREFCGGIFSLDSRKRIIAALKTYDSRMYIALSTQSLVNFLNYVCFLFVPIIAIQNNLSLTQIAIVFAIMRIPYLINILFGDLGDKYSKKILISLILIFMSFFYIGMGIYNNFTFILIMTFAISLGIAMLNPIVSALIGNYTQPQDKGVMTGAQEFMSRIGDIIGSLGFGTLTAFIGLNSGFILVGITIFCIGGYTLIKKLAHYRTRDGEKEKLQNTGEIMSTIEEAEIT